MYTVDVQALDVHSSSHRCEPCLAPRQYYRAQFASTFPNTTGVRQTKGAVGENSAGGNATFSSIGLDTPAFQKQLKQLKLQLHPDRVAAHPEARAANEQSFKVLSQYLDELRGTLLHLFSTCVSPRKERFALAYR